MYADDDTNALAAWSLLGPYPEKKIAEHSDEHNDDDNNENNASQPSSAGETDDSDISTSDSEIRLRYGPISNICDGKCGREWSYADEIYACKDCIDVQFDNECLELLKAGTLNKRVCNKSHDFLYVPAWVDELAAQVPKGSVRVGEEIITVEDWLAGIKQRWEI
ncbi:hypothetical protein VTO42DRAFT_8118 [Malbranchea cinnamomea]